MMQASTRSPKSCNCCCCCLRQYSKLVALNDGQNAADRHLDKLSCWQAPAKLKNRWDCPERRTERKAVDRQGSGFSVNFNLLERQVTIFKCASPGKVQSRRQAVLSHQIVELLQTNLAHFSLVSRAAEAPQQPPNWRQ